MTFPPMHERPCMQRPPNKRGEHVCPLPQDQCICYAETRARTRASKMKLLAGLLGIAFALAIWATFSLWVQR